MATAKYKTLATLYAAEIAEAKRLKAIAQKAQEELQAHYKASGMDEIDHYVMERQLYDAWGCAEYDFQAALESLTVHVREEYAEVPYGKAAEAGVDAFFREADI